MRQLYYRLAVEEDRARATHTAAANELSAGEPAVPNDVNKHGIVVGNGADLAIDHDIHHGLRFNYSNCWTERWLLVSEQLIKG
jgi:hypothetical protein